MEIFNNIGQIKISTLFKSILGIAVTALLCTTLINQVWWNIFTRDEAPIIIWWSRFMPNNTKRVIQCDQGTLCLVTSDRSYQASHLLGAYIFYGSHLDSNDFPIPRNYNIPWAVFHEESPKNYAPFLFKDVQNLFNLTSTFSRLSNFPLTLQYLPGLDLLAGKQYFVPVEEKNREPKAPVLFIQSDCDNPLNRDTIVQELMKYIEVDSYGKCLTNRQFPERLASINSLDTYNDEYMRFISRYKFIISFENAICNDYISEKLWRPLIVGAIPIYLGSPTVEDWLPNNSSAILVKNFPNMQDLADYIRKIDEKNSLYNSFMSHKLNGKISNDLLKSQVRHTHLESEFHYITDFECYVCQKIHQKPSFDINHANVYDCPKPTYELKNTWDQHWDIGKCQAKAIRLLMEKNVPFSNEDYDKIWQNLLNEMNC